MIILNKIIPLCILFVLLILSLGSKSAYCQDEHNENIGKLNIVVNYNLSLPTDTLELRIGTASIYNQYDKYIAINDSDGNFKFSIDSEYSHGYFRLSKLRPTRKNDNRLLTDYLFWESGDSLIIRVTEREYPEEPIIIREIEGVGAAKYKAWEEIEQHIPFFIKRLANSDDAQYLFYTWDNIEKDKLEILDKYRHQMSELSYDILKTKILMLRWPLTEDLSRNKWGKPEITLQPSEAAHLKKRYFPMKKYVKSIDALANSLDYIDFYTLYFTLYPVYKEAKYDKTRFPIANIDVESTVKQIIISSSGKVRQALIINFLNKIENLPTFKHILQKVKQYITDDYYLKQLVRIELRFDKGKNISHYNFTDSNEQEVKISDFKGEILFIDTWFTGCTGCVTYYRSIVSKLEEHFQDDERLLILSISSDSSEQIWKKSVLSGIYSNPKGINLFTSGMKMRHPMYQYLGINSGPTPLVVDREGNVVSFKSSDLYNIDKLLELIQGML